MVRSGDQFYLSDRLVALRSLISEDEPFIAKIINQWESECPHCQDKIDINELERRSVATKHPSSHIHKSTFEVG